MTFNPELIAKARKGEIAILNDGSVEELQSLLKEVWPLDTVIPEGVQKYYLRLNDEKWDGRSYTDLNHHSIKDFFMTDTKEQEIVWDSESFVKDDRPRTYKVTRQQMKEIWEAVSGVIHKNMVREMVNNSIDEFNNEGHLDDNDIRELTLITCLQLTLQRLFPEYFYIPEGEPVLCRDEDDEEWVIRISTGQGDVYGMGYISKQEGLEMYKQIITFTKTPPK